MNKYSLAVNFINTLVLTYQGVVIPPDELEEAASKDFALSKRYPTREEIISMLSLEGDEAEDAKGPSDETRKLFPNITELVESAWQLL